MRWPASSPPTHIRSHVLEHWGEPVATQRRLFDESVVSQTKERVMDMRDTEETVDVTPTEPSGGRGRRALGLGVTLAVVVALLAGFGALALSKHAPTLAPQTEPGSTAGW